VSAMVPTKIVPSSSSLSQRMSTDPIDIQLGPFVEMMSPVEVPEQSLTTGLVGVELSTIGVLPTPVSTLSSSKKVDYDVDWDDVQPSLNASKYSHLAKEEM